MEGWLVCGGVVSVWSEGVSVWSGWLVCGGRGLECYTHTLS